MSEEIAGETRSARLMELMMSHSEMQERLVREQAQCLTEAALEIPLQRLAAAEARVNELESRLLSVSDAVTADHQALTAHKTTAAWSSAVGKSQQNLAAAAMSKDQQAEILELRSTVQRQEAVIESVQQNVAELMNMVCGAGDSGGTAADGHARVGESAAPLGFSEGEDASVGAPSAGTAAQFVAPTSVAINGRRNRLDELAETVRRSLLVSNIRACTAHP